ncbi:hypothetical protein [Teredinibacter turnerae]|uniref:hypothetical protein n=1 Tax=Teredinibacter turnerae TaxID=2426 RepID=UPI00048ADB20|nr:hypothetical protein [Teredinibacter turnerae]
MKTFSVTTRKNVAAVLLGPLFLVPAMLLTYLVLALLNNGSPTNSSNVIGISLFFSFWGLIIAYPAAIVLGVPSVLILKRIGKLNYFTVLVAAIVWSIPLSAIFGIDSGSMLFVVYCACIVASGCWMVYKHV